MRYPALAVILILLFSCNQKESKIYSYSDIKFPDDNIRKAIEQNNICTAYYYAKNYCDSVMTHIYDKHGNMTRNIDGHYEYNDQNLLTYQIAGREPAQKMKNPTKSRVLVPEPSMLL